MKEPGTMKFLVKSIGKNHAKSIEEFKLGKINPPETIKVLGRWHGLGHAYTLLETNDMVSVHYWAASLSHLYDFDIDPVIDDTEAHIALGKLGKN